MELVGLDGLVTAGGDWQPLSSGAAQGGGPVEFISAGSFNNQINNSSTDITVPADAQAMVLTLSFYNGATPAGDPVPTLEGVALTRVVGPDASAAFFQQPTWYILAPATGAGQTIAWNFTAGIGTDGNSWCYAFFKGLNTGSVRDTDGTQSSSIPLTSPTLTAQNGDYVVACGGGFGASGTASWSGSTGATITNRVSDSTGNSYAAIGSGTCTGNVTAVMSVTSEPTEGGIACVVFIPG